MEGKTLTFLSPFDQNHIRILANPNDLSFIKEDVAKNKHNSNTTSTLQMWIEARDASIDERSCFHKSKRRRGPAYSNLPIQTWVFCRLLTFYFKYSKPVACVHTDQKADGHISVNRAHGATIYKLQERVGLERLLSWC